MKRYFLGEGLVIRRDGKVLEFLRRTRSQVCFEDPHDGSLELLTDEQFFAELYTREIEIVETFSSSKELAIIDQPKSVPADLADLPERYRNDLLRKHSYVLGMRKRNVTRGLIALIEEAIREIAEEIGDPRPPRPMTVAFWMRKFERAGNQTETLLSAHAARKVRKKVSLEHEQLINEAIETHYLTRESISVTTLYVRYNLMLRTLNEERSRLAAPPIRPISERTLRRRIDTLDAFDVVASREGKQAARRKFRMIKGSTFASRPLEFVEFDNTVLPFMAVDDVWLLPLGRPNVTALIDRFSGMIIGIYLSFSDPSISTVIGTLRHSLKPRIGLREAIPELEHDWPEFGPAETYVSDHGADFMSEAYRLVIAQLSSSYEYLRVRTPWHKPRIERLFGQLNSAVIDGLPGKTFENILAKGDYNSKGMACIPFTRLTQLLMKWVVDYHNYAPHRIDGARPIDLWHEGISAAPQPEFLLPDDLEIILGISETRSLSHEGIRYLNLCYANEELDALMQAVGPGRQVQIKIDPDNLGQIHVQDPRTRSYIRVSCTRPDYATRLTLFQHRMIASQMQARHRGSGAIDAFMETRMNLQRMILESIERSGTKRRSQFAHFANLNSNAAFDGKPNTLDVVRRAIQTPPSETKLTPFTSVPALSWTTKGGNS